MKRPYWYSVQWLGVGSDDFTRLLSFALRASDESDWATTLLHDKWGVLHVAVSIVSPLPDRWATARYLSREALQLERFPHNDICFAFGQWSLEEVIEDMRLRGEAMSREARRMR